MRAVEYSLLAVFHLAVVLAVYVFIIQPVTQAGLTPNLLAGVTGVEATTVPDGVTVLHDEDGNIRSATTVEEVEAVALNGIPGGADTVEGWFQQIVDALP